MFNTKEDEDQLYNLKMFIPQEGWFVQAMQWTGNIGEVTMFLQKSGAQFMFDKGFDLNILEPNGLGSDPIRVKQDMWLVSSPKTPGLVQVYTDEQFKNTFLLTLKA